jgi:NTP pyrophosphatase (non-canonical NTP hydrolase)
MWTPRPLPVVGPSVRALLVMHSAVLGNGRLSTANCVYAQSAPQPPDATVWAMAAVMGEEAVPQPMLTGLDLPDSAHVVAVVKRPAALSLRELGTWARTQATRIARATHTDRGSELMIYSQAAKLVEELGELHAELLGRSKRQRASKSQTFSDASLRGELADVILATAVLAEILHVDLADAVASKIATIDARNSST